MGRWFASTVVCVATLAATPAWAGPADWPEGSAEADDGATRDFYNRGAGLSWVAYHGDWVDRDLALHGDNHWSRAVVDDTDTARYVEWEVTDLVRAWIAGTLPNQGFYFRPISGGRNLIFSSREGPAGQHPELVVVGTAGTTTLEPEADTYLPDSTYQSQGEETDIRVGENTRALVRFDLSSLGSAEAVTSARVRLFTTTQYDSIDVGVEAVATGRQGPAPAIQTGIAAAFEGDDGIRGHADVLMFDDFEGDWESRWTSASGHFDVVASDPDNGFEPLDGSAFRMTLVENDNYGGSLIYDFADEVGAEPEQIYMRYYLRLGSTWAPTDSGKLPGLSGTYGVAGWGGRPVDGTNGWSARGLFKTHIPDAGSDNPLAGYTPIGSYVYHADMAGQYGDNFLWLEGWGEEGYGGILERNRWYCVEVYVRMNDPAAHDGVLRGWIDGRLAFEKTDFSFRTVDSLRIERVWMNIYHGGSTPSPHDQHVYFDNVVVARSYVGPIGGEVVGPDDVGVDPDAGTLDSGVDLPSDGGDDDVAGADAPDETEEVASTPDDASEDSNVTVDATSPTDRGDSAAQPGSSGSVDGGCGCAQVTTVRPALTPTSLLLLLASVLLWIRRS